MRCKELWELGGGTEGSRKEVENQANLPEEVGGLEGEVGSEQWRSEKIIKYQWVE